MMQFKNWQVIKRYFSKEDVDMTSMYMKNIKHCMEFPENLKTKYHKIIYTTHQETSQHTLETLAHSCSSQHCSQCPSYRISLSAIDRGMGKDGVVCIYNEILFNQTE
jgi:hypothetical protein